MLALSEYAKLIPRDSREKESKKFGFFFFLFFFSFAGLFIVTTQVTRFTAIISSIQYISNSSDFVHAIIRLVWVTKLNSRISGSQMARNLSFANSICVWVSEHNCKPNLHALYSSTFEDESKMAPGSSAIVDFLFQWTIEESCEQDHNSTFSCSKHEFWGAYLFRK